MEKLFVGNAKTVQTKYGEIVKLGFNSEHLELLANHVKKGWVNVALKKSQKGGYYMEIDTYQPKNTSNTPDEDEIDLEEVPF